MEIRDIVQVKGIAVQGKIISVKQEGTIADAIQTLSEHNSGLITVMRGTELAGVLSERDVVRALAKTPTGSRRSGWSL